MTKDATQQVGNNYGYWQSFAWSYIVRILAAVI